MAAMPSIKVEPDDTATTVAQTEHDQQVSTYEAKNHRNPPRASRHRAVFELPTAIPLFDMHHSTQNLDNVRNFYTETRQSVPLMLVKTITTDIRRPLQDVPDFVELLIRFYPDTEIPQNPSEHIEHYFIMPQTWAPKMYLGALHLSIYRHPVISLENITIEGVDYLTINEVHWMFSVVDPEKTELLRQSLEAAAAFLFVDGGTM
jgi:hypothetical protein